MTDILTLIEEHRRFWSIKDHEGKALYDQLLDGQNVISRTNFNGHVTASALVVNKNNNFVLFIKSVKFRKLLLPGGHVEGNENLHNTAMRELREETGLINVNLHEFNNKLILPIEINTHEIAENKKKMEIKHLHHDFVYLFYTKQYDDLLFKSDGESSMTAWYEVETLKASYPKSLNRLKAHVGIRK